jgi:hypothetical protein
MDAHKKMPWVQESLHHLPVGFGIAGIEADRDVVDTAFAAGAV